MGLQATLSGDNRHPLTAALILQLAQHLQLSPSDFRRGVEGFVWRPFAGWVELS